MAESQAVKQQTKDDLAILVRSGLLKDFYLAGGTGLAFLLNHRESYDLDFFRSSNFDTNQLSTQLSQLAPFSLEKKETGTIRGKFNETIVSFFHYPYPILEPAENISNVPVASIKDIACMKIDAISSRSTKRDFIDVYFIIKKRSLSLPEILFLFSKKYNSLDYNLMHIQKSLVYFNDADSDPMPRMVEPVEWDEVKVFFINEIKKL